jgi:hypothetical protein
VGFRHVRPYACSSLSDPRVCTNVLNLNRRDSGEGALLSQNLQKQMEINKYHYSKEIVATVYTSMILPKHSLLKVIYDTGQCKVERRFNQ